MSGLRISVHGSKQLQAIILAMKVLDRETKKILRRETKAMVDPEWRKAVTEHASTRLEHRVLADTARVRVSDQNVTLSSATVGRSLSGGLKPSTHYYLPEFGADRSQERTYDARSRKGTAYQVTRHTTRQFRPRNRKGYVVYPAAADIIPRIAALWTQTIVRGIHEAFEKR